MKICIVANGFTGATLPLAQHLYKKGQEVECFYIVKCGTTCIESVDFLKPIKFAVKPTRLELTNKLYNYLDSNIPINLVSVFKKKRRLEKLFIGKIPAYINRVVINNLFKQIVQNGYDFVNIVIHSYI